MTELFIGLVVFFGIHSVSVVNEPWRDAMVERLGELAWKGLYSVIALAGLLLIIYGYGSARYDPVLIYFPPTWLRHLSMLLLIMVFPLLLAAYFPGRIKSVVKHPMLLAVKIWAFAHLLVNGMLADLILFGSFLLWAVTVRISMKYRKPRSIPGLPASSMNDAIAIVSGLLIYVLVVFWMHVRLTGVSVV